MSKSLAPETGDMWYPTTNYYAGGMGITVNQNQNLLAAGMDPKPLVLEYCKPQCKYW